MPREKLPKNFEKSEKKHPKELITPHQLGEYLAEAKPQFKGELIKNTKNRIKSYIEEGQKAGRTKEGKLNSFAILSAWNAFVDYTCLMKQSDLQQDSSSKFKQWLEQNIRNPNLIKNIEEKIRLDIQEGQKQNNINNIYAAWNAFSDYASLKQSGLQQEFSPEFKKWVDKNIKHPNLIKNFGASMATFIQLGKQANGFKAVPTAGDSLRGYTFFKQSGLQKEFSSEFTNWLEENIRDQILVKNANELLKHDMQRGQQFKDSSSATSALLGYAALFQLHQIMEKDQK